jgi:hypothetical protein
MKGLTTMFCCFAFMIFGAGLALQELSTPNTQTAMASPPVFNYTGKLPLDLQLDLEKRQKTDTVHVMDTVVREKIVSKIKYVKVPQRKRTTDSIMVMPIPGPIPDASVNNSIAGDREEHTPDELQSSKQSSITLTVDGQIVYSSENDIHSTEDRQ